LDNKIKENPMKKIQTVFPITRNAIFSRVREDEIERFSD
jgi:hypothetical protein